MDISYPCERNGKARKTRVEGAVWESRTGRSEDGRRWLSSVIPPQMLGMRCLPPLQCHQSHFRIHFRMETPDGSRFGRPVGGDDRGLDAFQRWKKARVVFDVGDDGNGWYLMRNVAGKPIQPNSFPPRRNMAGTDGVKLEAAGTAIRQGQPKLRRFMFL